MATRKLKPREAKAKKRSHRRKSVLDFVMDDAKGLQNQMGATEQKPPKWMNTSPASAKLRFV